MQRTYRIIYLLSRLKPSGLSAWKNTIKTPKTLEDSADALYYAALSKELLREAMPLTKKQKNEITSLGIRRLKYIPEITRCITLMKKTGTHFPGKEYTQWLKDAQMPDGGFGFLHNSTSYLETTCYALRALNALNSAPDDLTECEKFIRLCRCQEGYGRQMLSKATIESTYHAVSGLKETEKMRQRI